MRRIASLLLAVLALAGGPAAAKETSRPVKVGAEAELDACTSIGHVEGGALAVQASPHAGARTIDRLGEGHILWICEQPDPGDGKVAWYGVVYGPAAQSHGKEGVPPACGVDAPIAKPRAYRGPCRSGWAPAARIHMDAG